MIHFEPPKDSESWDTGEPDWPDKTRQCRFCASKYKRMCTKRQYPGIPGIEPCDCECHEGIKKWNQHR